METKTYVITGATSGIGNAIVRRIAKDSIVFAGYRNPEYIAKLKEISSNIFPFYIDYSKEETIAEASEYILSKTTQIDTLINVAGCVVAGPIEKIQISELKRQFDINVFGHINFSQRLLDSLDGGRIINISSMASYGIFPYISPYCASKRCLDILFNSLLIETKKNIKVISIKPGAIATPLWNKSIEENKNTLRNCDEYKDEMNFIAQNAEANTTKGLNVEKVVDTVIKADNAKNPKLSYLVGKDAIGTSLIAKLPQKIINKIVNFGMEQRIKNNNK